MSGEKSLVLACPGCGQGGVTLHTYETLRSWVCSSCGWSTPAHPMSSGGRQACAALAGANPEQMNWVLVRAVWLYCPGCHDKAVRLSASGNYWTCGLCDWTTWREQLGWASAGLAALQTANPAAVTLLEWAGSNA